MNPTQTATAVTARIRLYLPVVAGISHARRTPSCPTANVVLLSVSASVVSLAAPRRRTGTTA